MDEREKFADVVGADGKSLVKETHTGLGIYALIFHDTGIAGASGIYGDAVFDDIGGIGIEYLIAHGFAFAGVIDVGSEALIKRGLCGGASREAFVFGSGVALGLHLAGGPTIVHTRVVPLPDGVVFVFFLCHRCLFPWG